MDKSTGAGAGTAIQSSVTHLAEWAAAIIELIGVSLIALVAIFAVLYTVFKAFERAPLADTYGRIRLLLAKSVLLGLEFLVAADIIHTVAVDLTFETVGILAAIVLIRTFLSFTIELEVTGRWPWQGK